MLRCYNNNCGRSSFRPNLTFLISAKHGKIDYSFRPVIITIFSPSALRSKFWEARHKISFLMPLSITQREPRGAGFYYSPKMYIIVVFVFIETESGRHKYEINKYLSWHN